MISIIIPVSSLVRKAVPKRLESVQCAIRDFYKGCEVIVVEQSLDGQLYFIPRLKGVKTVKLNYPVFNKSWCLNVGVKHATNDYVVVADADMYARNVNWQGLLNWMNQGQLWSFVWNQLHYTNDQQRKLLLGGINALPSLKVVRPKPGYSEGGLVCFYKPFFYNIGQFNECMTELGGPDNEIILRAKHVYEDYPKYPATVYHLFHEQKPKSQRPTRRENIKILKQTRDNRQKMIDWLKKQAQGLDTTPLSARKEIWQ
jgi:glycosyltransferase involved in cell wall biosynthesis